MILIVKHISIEGPGTIAEFFDRKGIEYKTIELCEGENVPLVTEGLDGVIILGGPMNVYEQDKHPYLIEENQFIKKVINEEIPLLGICLGSQLIAKACHAKVKKAPIKEHGFSVVNQTEEGALDPLFEGLGDQIIAFQWHEDTFDIPTGATLLSTSSACPHQAFKVGKNIYGLQYHIEVDQAIIESWIMKYFNVDSVGQSKEGLEMIKQFEQLKEQFKAQSEKIYLNFEMMINQHKEQRIKV